MRGFVALGMALGAMLMAPAALAAPAPPARAADTVVIEDAHSGGYFAATSTNANGGSIYQDVALSTSAGETVCGSAWVRSQVPATGASGTFALFLLGGSATDCGGANFSGLGYGDNNWTQVQGCVEATGSHTTLRIQVYPNPGGPTVEIDDVDVHVSLAANGGFETGMSAWAPYPGTNSNFVVYANGATTAHTGSHFGATNTTADGGGIYQDIALNTSAGQTVCGSAWVRTEAPATGASGTFALFLVGSAATDAGGANFSGLPNGDHWTQVHDCVEATGAHTTLRVQFYPDPRYAHPRDRRRRRRRVDGRQRRLRDRRRVLGDRTRGPAPSTAAFTNGASTAHTRLALRRHQHHRHWRRDLPGRRRRHQAGADRVRLRLGPDPRPRPRARLGPSLSSRWAGAPRTAAARTSAAWATATAGAQIQTCAEATGGQALVRLQFYPAPERSRRSRWMTSTSTDRWPPTAALRTVPADGSPTRASTPATSSSRAARSRPRSSRRCSPTRSRRTIPLGTGTHALRIKLVIKWTWRYGTTRIRKVTIGRFPHSTHLTSPAKGRGVPVR